MLSLAQRFFASQVRISKRIDAALFPGLSRDGNTAFDRYVRELELEGVKVADVGAGRTPFFSPDEVAVRGLGVVGVDIDAEELAAAPRGSYGSVLVSALESLDGQGYCDVVIAQSVLEHVSDGRCAARGISSLLRDDGLVVTFCPSRRAWFARLNLLLSESLKRRILFYVFPGKRDRQGFPAHYDGCTPEEMIANMRAVGVECIELRCFHVSSYFMFFVPFYLFWRLVNLPLMLFAPVRYCETFIFVGRKSVRGDAAEDRKSFP